ncbi:MAG: hypothetical protein U0174_07650 [Polyangiaceae bacterium]
MKKLSFGCVSAMTAAALTLVPCVAYADDDGNGGEEPKKKVEVKVTAPSTAAAKDAAPEVSDHEKFVGRFAIGYFGVADVPIAASLPAIPDTLPTNAVATPVQTRNIAAPVIGARYWISNRFGIDAGIGMGWSSGGSSTNTSGSGSVATEGAGAFGFIFHGGVPIALAGGKHYTFQLVPELNVGFSTQTLKPPPGSPNNTPDTSLSGFRFDIGARAGAEIHFGFMGIPELALQASVGMYFQAGSVSATQGQKSASSSSSGFGTTVQADPWALFTKNIAALYYF